MGIGIFLDVILIAILVLNIAVGYRKGLINVVFSIFAFLIAIIATVILYKPVANIIIDNTQIDENIQEIVMQNNLNTEKAQDTKAEVTGVEQPETWLQKYIADAVKNATDDAKEQAMDVAAKTISIKLIDVLTGIILFIIIRIALILLKFLSETLASLPIIKQFNEVGGLLYGAIKGLIIILLILTILFFVVSINGSGKISQAIEESYITKNIYNYYSNKIYLKTLLR